MNRAKFGWIVPTFSGANDVHIEVPSYERFQYSTTQEIALLCESLGYDSLWIPDHLIFGDRGEVAECWTLLSALAAVTRRIRLGPLVLCEAHRSPALVAKMVSTLDNISEGRVNFGVGAGWRKIEQVSYGLPWLEKPLDRVKRTEEGIEIVRRMWTEDRPNFEGKYYRIRDATCNPKPVQKPYPPIWIAGHGERMLKLVAKYADGWNWMSTTVDEHQKLINTIRESCERIGRNHDNITMSWQGRILIARSRADLKEKIDAIHRLNPRYPLSLDRNVMEVPAYESVQRDVLGASAELIDFRAQGLVGTPEEIVERMRRYMDIGVQHFILQFLDYPSTDGIELVAEKVMPALR